MNTILKRKVNSRKKNCPACNVQTGSLHTKNCKYAYTGFSDMKRLSKISLGEKIKIIAEIIKQN